MHKPTRLDKLSCAGNTNKGQGSRKVQFPSFYLLKPLNYSA